MAETPESLFDDALFYGAADDAELHCAEWEEYLLDALTDMHPDDRFEESITVTAYRRTPVDESLVKSVAQRMAQSVADDEWCDFEEHANPRFDVPFLERETKDELRQGLQAVLSRILRTKAKLWRCEPIATRTFSPSELHDFWDSAND